MLEQKRAEKEVRNREEKEADAIADYKEKQEARLKKEAEENAEKKAREHEKALHDIEMLREKRIAQKNADKEADSVETY